MNNEMKILPKIWAERLRRDCTVNEKGSNF
jgi:hypothetical protein